jgi:hypothetical protein
MTTRDPNHWLLRYSAREWIAAGLAELRRAGEAYEQRNLRGGHAGALRAAGMALNGALVVQPDESWGRSYVDHIRALGRDTTVPAEVREAARTLLDAPAPGGQVVLLRTPSTESRFLEAARTLMAHAYALVLLAEPDAPEPHGHEAAGPADPHGHEASSPPEPAREPEENAK